MHDRIWTVGSWHAAFYKAPVKKQNKTKTTAWTTASKVWMHPHPERKLTPNVRPPIPLRRGHLAPALIPLGRPNGTLNFALREKRLHTFAYTNAGPCQASPACLQGRKKPGRETSQQRKDLGKTCTEGDRNARLRRQPPRPGEAARVFTWLGRQVDVWQARACAKCALGSQGSWNEACRFRPREGGRKRGEKRRARFALIESD